MQQQAKVWVAYTTPEQQFYLEVSFFAAMTVADAIELSGIRQRVPLPDHLSLGIFGVKVTDLNQCLEVGDRVEIYRPLLINPKEIRRQRAAANPVGRYCRGNRLK